VVLECGFFIEKQAVKTVNSAMVATLGKLSNYPNYKKFVYSQNSLKFV
jgi:hypothetical protein